MRNITVVGTGYVGLSLAVLLAKKNNVIALDIDQEKIKKINNRESPIKDKKIDNFFKKEQLNLSGTTDSEQAYKEAEFIIIATPTNYDEEIGFFDTSSVNEVLEKILSFNKKATIIIKSTLPVGFTEKARKKFRTNNLFFSPEFLREGTALEDNLNPDRIIVGGTCNNAKEFANLLIDSAEKKPEEIEILLLGSTESEAIKLFSNTYLAMRVAYFNELDSYCSANNLKTKQIINGVCSDKRIGKHYNNPSFGYGGYCLPKDSKQLLANFHDVPNNIIKAIVEANITRKDFISDLIISKKPNVVGIFRLVMKKDSDNFRSSAIQEIIKKIKSEGIEVIIYEPELKESKFFNSNVISSLEEFKQKADLIVANRISDNLADVSKKIFTRDIFGNN